MSKRVKISKKTFVFTHEGVGIKEVKFEQLRAGDIFYCELMDGELDVMELSDHTVAFIWVALTDPAEDASIPDCMSKWFVEVRPIVAEEA